MKLLSTVLALAISIATYAQTDTSKIIHDPKLEKLLNDPNAIKIQARFPGGPEAWMNYLQTNLNVNLGNKYLKPNKGETSTQIATISFQIDTLGNTVNIKIDNPDQVHPKLAEESIRVIKKSPKWIPATINNIPVTYYQKQSFTWSATGD
jgi:protein TonB